MSEVIIALLVLIFFVAFLLLFCIIVLALALVIFTGKGKKGEPVAGKYQAVKQKHSPILSRILDVQNNTSLTSSK